MDPLTDWLQAQGQAAWDRLTVRYGPQPQAYKNTFFHAYGAALLTLFFGAIVAISAGHAREIRTWARDHSTIGGRRDVFKDIYNNNIGVQITAELVRQGVNLSNTAALEEGMGTVTICACYFAC